MDRDSDVGAKFINHVEDYYDLQPQVMRTSLLPKDLMQESNDVSSNVMSALAELDISSNVVRISANHDPITFR